MLIDDLIARCALTALSLMFGTLCFEYCHEKLKKEGHVVIHFYELPLGAHRRGQLAIQRVLWFFIAAIGHSRKTATCSHFISSQAIVMPHLQLSAISWWLVPGLGYLLAVNERR